MEMIKDTEFIKKVDALAKPVLEANNVTFEDEQYAEISRLFFNTTWDKMMQVAKDIAVENGNNVTINVGDRFSIIITDRVSDDGEKDGNLNIGFEAGPRSKLIIKQDSATEGADD